MLKIIFGIIILAISFAVILLPLAIGVIVGIFAFYSGNVTGGIIAIVIGIAVQVIWTLYMYNGEGLVSGRDEEECPYCGSGDTDGNHCYTCEDDF